MILFYATELLQNILCLFWEMMIIIVICLKYFENFKVVCVKCIVYAQTISQVWIDDDVFYLVLIYNV